MITNTEHNSGPARLVECVLLLSISQICVGKTENGEPYSVETKFRKVFHIHIIVTYSCCVCAAASGTLRQRFSSCLVCNILAAAFDSWVSCARANHFLLGNAQDNFIQIFDRHFFSRFIRLFNSFGELFYVCVCVAYAKFFVVVAEKKNILEN